MVKGKELTKKQLIDKAVNKWVEQNSRYGKTLAEIVWDESRREAFKEVRRSVGDPLFEDWLDKECEP